ncbi:TauD/TfdA family dioxygenase [Nonomuraea jiangxiensis]|uniref:Taurine catabolism dioxygenase TauD, TfdA family n=1 Tax=Nonomuraea jiangxiensis TaxID=633440 RepID=A0A1G8EMP0_9ACTN|nr:TauD/TfdA family dioxygenase [Nonomuraea jiangxiensis]SDH70979.1 Taurine catabolism dioxygenase TauD, TfdA family [Nonomuraea jiangxiensis]
MLYGAFTENSTDQHVAFRRDLLDSGKVLPPPPVPVTHSSAADFLDGPVHDALRELATTGTAIVQLDEPLHTRRFLALGALLGQAMPRMDPAVQPYVENDVILHLRREHVATANVSLQPFATNSLSLHTESSGRRAEEQPRYIVLMCVTPGDDPTAAQTVLVPMTAIERALTPESLSVLARTRYRHSTDGPRILRTVEGRRVFSFRDFLSQPLHWAHPGDDADETVVNRSILDLLAAMYGSTAAGVHWSRGMIVIIDNARYFHGRTASPSRAAVTDSPRHLKRLRIT